MGLASRLRSTYQAVLAAKKVGHLEVGDPALQMIYEVVGNLPPERARAAALRAADYYSRNGFAMSDAELDAMMDELRGPTGSQQGYDPLVGAGAPIRQGYADLTQQRGTAPTPQDPQVGALIKSAIPGLNDAQAGQVAQFGRDWYLTTGTVAPDYAVDQYAGNVKGFRVPLAHQMDPGTFDAMQRDPVAKGLFDATIAAKGYDPASYYGQHLAARPKGTAPRTGSVARNFAGVWS